MARTKQCARKQQKSDKQSVNKQSANKHQKNANKQSANSSSKSILKLKKILFKCVFEAKDYKPMHCFQRAFPALDIPALAAQLAAVKLDGKQKMNEVFFKNCPAFAAINLDD